MELNKAVLDCMQTLRRRLREELGAEIHLNQSDVISALLAACARSESLQTRQLGEQLNQLCGMPTSVETARGQPSQRGQTLADDDPEPPSGERQVRIYRGQRISG